MGIDTTAAFGHHLSDLFDAKTYQCSLIMTLKHMWSENGDELSLQYSGAGIFFI